MTSCVVSLLFDDVHVRKFSQFLTVLVPYQAYFRATISPIFPGRILFIEPKNFHQDVGGGVGGLNF